MSPRSLFLTTVSALLLPLLASSRSAAEEWSLSGSLIAHDPTLIREGKGYWCFYTGKGLPSKSSCDGLVWTLRPPLFTEELSWWRTYAPNMGPVDIWAPDVQHHAGRYWLYYSVSEFGKNNSAIGLMSCSSLAAWDWRDEGFVIGSKNGRDAFNAIDPNLAFDHKGNPWLAFGSWSCGICLVPLDPSTLKPKGPVQTLAHRANGIEGPNIVYRDGYYYLFVSIDKCCVGVDSTYKTTVGRSKAITGPYLDKLGVDMLSGGGSLLEEGGPRWKGPGGQDVSQIGDAWVIARHAYDAENKGAPTLRIADLYWDADGWPTLHRPAKNPSSQGD